MVLSFLDKIKQKLQFTGWLQYIPIAFLSLLVFLFAAVRTFFYRFEFQPGTGYGKGSLQTFRPNI